MICDYCGKDKLVEDTLEGVAFEPLATQNKFLSKGIYGIKVTICLECGHMSNFSLNDDAIKKLKQIIKSIK